VVEHSLGKGEVDSSILSGSTINTNKSHPVIALIAADGPVRENLHSPCTHRPRETALRRLTIMVR
jgi:hypothetical protein